MTSPIATGLWLASSVMTRLLIPDTHMAKKTNKPLFLRAGFNNYSINKVLNYLIRTGIGNLKDNVYSLNIFLIIKLVIHFLSTVALLIYSLYLSPSKEASGNLLFTTLLFFIIGIAIGIYDTKQFYKSWKGRRLA